MSDALSTHYVGQGFAVSEEVVLDTTAKTRTVFRPGMHGGGVRGHLIRQKLGTDGTWKDTNQVNFTTLPADCGVRIELNTEATEKLYQKLGQLYEVQKQHGVQTGDHKYLIAEAGKSLVIDDNNKAQVIRALLDAGHTEDFWAALLQLSPDLAAGLAAAKIQLDREAAIKAFEAALPVHAKDESYWQGFFEEHSWMLQTAFSATVFMLNGETYVGGKRSIGRQGMGGVATDFLFSDESTKSFAVVEIKTPHTELVGSQYRGVQGSDYDNETYSMHSELSGGIVQVRNQIAVAVEQFQAVVGRTYTDLNAVHPRGVLVIGTVAGLSPRKKDSFNHFRQGLFSLSVITFDELLQRLKVIFQVSDEAK
jgi:hypothetical protein